MDISPLNFFVAPLIFDRFFKPKKEEEIKKPLTLQQAQAQVQEIIAQAKNEAARLVEKTEEEAKTVRQESLELREKMKARREKWQERVATFKKRVLVLKTKEKALFGQQQKLFKLEKTWQEKLSLVAKLTPEKARQEYFEALNRQLTEEAAKRIRENEEKIAVQAEVRSKEILISTMQRISTEHVPVATTSQVKLPNEDIKGRIIGKEGRNIKAFEAVTGVGVEIGEENEVLVSSFDPVRREIAKISLERLIADGRIQPSRIEEVVNKVGDEIYQIIHKAGEDLAYQSRVYDLPREIIDLLGKFKYRTSYGQSMWEHTLEVVRLGEALAAEVGVRVDLVRKACLLHDIGKAVTVETDKGHAEVGAEVCRRNGVAEEVVRTFEGHHTEDFPNLESIIVYLADAISGARPGARREDFEAYLRRIDELEKIADSFEGVDRVYALSAGREVRVIVRPQDVSDAQMVKLAHDISSKIHKTLQNFPAPIKVNVIRETRASATAKPKVE